MERIDQVEEGGRLRIDFSRRLTTKLLEELRSFIAAAISASVRALYIACGALLISR